MTTRSRRDRAASAESPEGPPRKSRGGRPPSPATSDVIKHAAIACFAAKGYSATTIDDIARAAGTSRAGVYKYFESKEHLAAELEKDYHRDLSRRLAPILTAAEDEPPAQTIAKLAAEMIASFEAEPERAKAIATAPRPLMDLTPEGEAMMPELRAEIARRIAALAAPGAPVDPLDLDFAVVALFQTWLRVALYYLARTEGAGSPEIRARAVSFLERAAGAFIVTVVGRPVE